MQCLTTPFIGYVYVVLLVYYNNTIWYYKLIHNVLYFSNVMLLQLNFKLTLIYQFIEECLAKLKLTRHCLIVK